MRARTVGTLSMVILLGVVAVGLTILPVEGAMIFRDDFETATAVSPSAFPNSDGDCDPNRSSPAGTSWVLGDVFGGGSESQIDAIQVTSYGTPGPANGSNYLRIHNIADATHQAEAHFGQSITDPITIDFNAYIPTHAIEPTQSSASSMIWYLMDSADAMVVALFAVHTSGSPDTFDISFHNGTAWGDTGLDFTPDTWQHWQIRLVPGAATFTLTVGASSGTFAQAGGVDADWMKFVENRTELGGPADNRELDIDDVIVEHDRAGWTHWQALTFDNTGAATDLDDFAVVVRFDASDTKFWANVNPAITKTDTKDLMFYDADDTTELYFEAEKLDYAAQEAITGVDRGQPLNIKLEPVPLPPIFAITACAGRAEIPVSLPPRAGGEAAGENIRKTGVFGQIFPLFFCFQ